jgi:hypothetical protein
MVFSSPQLEAEVRTRTLTLVAGGVALALFTARPAFAQGQDTFQGDLAISYSVLHDSAPQTFPSGFILALTGDVNKMLRIVAEFGGNYKTVNVATATNISLQVITYQGGLRFASGGKAMLKPFVQFLAGGARSTDTVLGSGSSGSSNGFAVQPGGGVDFRVADRFDGRIQVDYRAIRSGGATAREFRVGVGFVIPFGR